MKTTITLKEFSALSFDAGKATGRTVPVNGNSPQQTPKKIRPLDLSPVRSDKSFREMLHRVGRDITQLLGEPSYRRYGINE